MGSAVALSYNDILEILRHPDAKGDEVLIVKSASLIRLLSLIPRDVFEKYVAQDLGQFPEVDTPEFLLWLREARRKTGLSQRAFAALISTEHCPIFGSDIGNLERGRRLANYRSKRLALIRVRIIEKVFSV